MNRDAEWGRSCARKVQHREWEDAWVQFTVMFSLWIVAILASAADSGTASNVVVVPAGWTVYRGRDGLLVQHPVGWQVQERGGGSFAVVEPGGGGTPSSVAVVSPMQQINGSAAGIVASVGALMPDLFPSASPGTAGIISAAPEVGSGTFTFAERGQAFQGRALCFTEGDRGVLYAVAARQSLFAERFPIMKRILTSFVYAARTPASAGAARVPEMVAWTDPNEGAFSMPVPRGWHVAGGLTRISNVEVRPELVAESPDGAVLIRVGDASLSAMMVTPNPTTAMAAPEGTVYRLQDGLTTSLVLRYLPGARFLADYYLPMRLGQVTILQMNDLGDVSRATMAAVAPLFAALGVVGRVDTGEVRFQLGTDAGRRVGYGLCQTQGSASPAALQNGAANWVVSMLVGYVATPDQEAVARVVTRRMAEGFRENPEWRHRQNVLAAQTSGILSEATSEMSDMMYRSWAERARRDDAMIEHYDQRVVRGQVEIQDPSTGQRYNVAGGSNYYWRVGPGEQFVGTEFNVDAPGYWVDRMDLLR